MHMHDTGTQLEEESEGQNASALSASTRILRRTGSKSKDESVWISPDGGVHHGGSASTSAPPGRASSHEELPVGESFREETAQQSQKLSPDKASESHMSALGLWRLLLDKAMTVKEDFVLANIMIALLCCLVCFPLCLRLYFALPMARAEMPEPSAAQVQRESIRARPSTGGSIGGPLHHSRRTPPRQGSKDSPAGPRAGARTGGSSRGRSGRDSDLPQTKRGAESKSTADSPPPIQMAFYGAQLEAEQSGIRSADMAPSSSTATTSTAPRSTPGGSARSQEGQRLLPPSAKASTRPRGTSASRPKGTSRGRSASSRGNSVSRSPTRSR